jgi:hypothetical protein
MPPFFWPPFGQPAFAWPTDDTQNLFWLAPLGRAPTGWPGSDGTSMPLGVPPPLGTTPMQTGMAAPYPPLGIVGSGTSTGGNNLSPLGRAALLLFAGIPPARPSPTDQISALLGLPPGSPPPRAPTLDELQAMYQQFAQQNAAFQRPLASSPQAADDQTAQIPPAYVPTPTIAPVTPPPFNPAGVPSQRPGDSLYGPSYSKPEPPDAGQPKEEATPDARDLRRLSDDEIKRLKAGSVDIHELKGPSDPAIDLYKDGDGNIYILPQGNRNQ